MEMEVSDDEVLVTSPPNRRSEGSAVGDEMLNKVATVSEAPRTVQVARAPRDRSGNTEQSQSRTLSARTGRP